MKLRIVLIGCSKTKNEVDGDVTPVELYSGQLFEKRVAYAEARAFPWLVLSAAYGVWEPHIVRSSYELKITELTRAELAAWHLGVASRLAERCWLNGDDHDSKPSFAPKHITFEIHAGLDYREPLASILREVGFGVLVPCAGLGIGSQLKWYADRVMETASSAAVGESSG